MESSANKVQVGGQHYKSAIQHWDFVVANGLGYFEGQITKYVTRWDKKNGLQDLEKAKHFLDKLMEEVKAGRITQQLGPPAPPPAEREIPAYRVFKDGSDWCAVGPGFVNMQESLCEFHADPVLALRDLLKAEKEARGLIFSDAKIIPPPPSLALAADLPATAVSLPESTSVTGEFTGAYVDPHERKQSARFDFIQAMLRVPVEDVEMEVRRLQRIEHLAQGSDQLVIKKGSVNPAGWLGFTFEGAKENKFEFRCSRCRQHFETPADDAPSLYHDCRDSPPDNKSNAVIDASAAEPGGAYVKQN